MFGLFLFQDILYQIWDLLAKVVRTDFYYVEFALSTNMVQSTDGTRAVLDHDWYQLKWVGLYQY